MSNQIIANGVEVGEEVIMEVTINGQENKDLILKCLEELSYEHEDFFISVKTILGI